MRYRSRANPRVTIEAMRLPAESEDASEALIEFIADLGESAQSGRHGSLDIYSGSTAQNDAVWTNVAPGEWLLKDANGFAQKATHEEFEAEWEPIDEQ